MKSRLFASFVLVAVATLFGACGGSSSSSAPSPVTQQNTIQITELPNQPAGATMSKGQFVRFTVQYTAAELPVIVAASFLDSNMSFVANTGDWSIPSRNQLGTIVFTISVDRNTKVVATKYIKVMLIRQGAPLSFPPGPDPADVLASQILEWPYNWVSP